MRNLNRFQGNSSVLEHPSSRNHAVTSHSVSQHQMLVLIDSSLEDALMLVTGVQPDAEAILLDPLQDGIEQITQVLSERTNISSIHLVAHGSSGRLKLGSSELSLDNIDSYTHQLKTWSDRLLGSSLLIYGCEVADGESGIEFLQRLHQLTGANIAAATGKIGSSARGGTWHLDYQIGQIASDFAFVPSVQRNYSGVFANYNESVDGDISDNRSAPDSLQLEEGVNSLTATSSGGDLEYITVNVPAGFQLDSLILADYVSEDAVAFAGVQSGTTFTEPPSGTEVGNLLGWTHMRFSQRDTDILDDIGGGSGAIGFTAPLASGNYTFWLQQLGEPTTYTLEFNVSPVASTAPVVSFTAAPTLLDESEGTELTLTFNLDKAPPAGGVKVYVDSSTVDAINELDISTLEFTGGDFPEPNEDASGFYFNITGQTATITLKVFADGETEGTENLTFALQSGDGYTVDPNANSTTITINDEDVISMPTVSFDTIAGSFDPEDNILAAELVQSLEDGSSLLTFVFNVDEEIPEGGLIVDVNSDIALTDYFTGLARPPFGIGGQIVEAIYDPQTGEATGFRFRITEQNAQVGLRLSNNDEADSIVDATFTLEDGEDYNVDPEADSSTLTIYDTLENIPEPTSVPEVNFSVSTTDLVESEGTVLTIDFTVDGEIPEDGLLVYVAAPQQFLGDLDIFAIEIEGGVFPAPNFLSTGFFFKIYEPDASITIPIFPDGESEGIENVTLSLQEAPGYNISPDAEAITLTLSDTAESEIQVSLTTEPTLLIESEGTVSVHTFTLSALPPAGGLTVSVSAPNIGEFNLADAVIEGGTITVTENGFDLTITEQEATIELPIANDGVAEGLETATFTLVDGMGYQISETENSGSFTIVDDPSQIPPPTTISEPNDIISLAVDTNLGELNPTASFSSSIDYDNTNRYAVGDGFLYVDATEDVDLYKVELQAGDVLRLDIDALQIGSTLNSVLRVFDEAGVQLAQNDNGSAPGETFLYRNDSYLEFTAATAGTYYVGVSSNPNGEFPAIANEDPYDPNVPASGTGRSRGTYTLNLSINQAVSQPPTTPDPSTGTGPAISLGTVAGVFDDNDNILASAPVRSLEDGASLVNLILSAEGEIPEGGVEVYISSDILLSDYFNIANFPFTPGAQVVGAFYNEEGQASGLVVNLLAPNAVISLRLFNNAAATGIEEATFTLEDAAGYVVDPENSTDTVTFYDTLANVPPATVTPEVSFSATTTSLSESEGETTLNFSLSEAPPEEGVLVYVAAPQQFIGDLDVLNAVVDGGVFPAPNFSSSGFFFRIYEQEASITVSVFPDEDIEGLESYTLSLQSAPGYTIDPDAEPVTITITDTAASLIQVSLSRSPATLIEAAGTVAVQTFTLSAEPPEGGVTVSVSAPNLSEFDVDAIAVTGGTIGDIRDDGFDLTITDRTATVSLPIASDDVEGQETATFSLVAGTGYQLGTTGTSVSFTVLDVAAVTETEVNDTIAQAQDTNLSGDQPNFTINGAISVGPNDPLIRPSQIDASEDIDLYKVDLVAGETIAIDIDSTTYTIAASTVPQRLDSELRVFNAEGEQLAFNADGFAPDELFVAARDPYLEFTAEADGTYYIGVAQWQNRIYDPLTANNSSGRINIDQGRNTGAYTLNIDLTTDPSVIVGVTVSAEVVEEGENVTFTFNVEGEIPEEGLLITTNSIFGEGDQFDFNFDFEDPTYINGLEYVDFIVTPEGEETIIWRLTEPDAFITLPIFDDVIAEPDDEFTLEVLPGEGYEVDPEASSATTTIVDEINIEGPTVSLSLSEPTDFIESEGGTLTFTFTVDGVIPEGGLEVAVDTETPGILGDFVIFDAEGNFLPETTGIIGVPENNTFDASGFSVVLGENTASITVDIYQDGPNEGFEEATFTLLDGEEYEVDPDNDGGTITIDDGDDGGPFFGTAGDDVFQPGGSVVVLGEFNGSNDQVFAGAGDDTIDSSSGGGNRLYGQSGNDTFYLGSDDFASGGSGDDTFYALGQEGTITGGPGADKFWIVSGELEFTYPTITDFELGTDLIGIGLPDASFDDLNLVQQGTSTEIRLLGDGFEEYIGVVTGITPNQLSDSNFVFI